MNIQHISILYSKNDIHLISDKNGKKALCIKGLGLYLGLNIGLNILVNLWTGKNGPTISVKQSKYFSLQIIMIIYA